MLLALLWANFCVAQQLKTIYLDEMDLSQIHQGWAEATAKKNLRNKPITLEGKVYERGICTHAFSEAILQLNKQAVHFSATVGIEDINATLSNKKDVIFYAVADKKRVFTSPVLTAGGKAVKLDLDVAGVSYLELFVEGIGGTEHTHTSYADAKITYKGSQAPKLIRYKGNTPEENEKYILTPKPLAVPKITGPKVFGLRPNSPIVFSFTAVGEKPIQFSAQGLPKGITLNPSTGELTGSCIAKGDYKVSVKASNAKGSTERGFTLRVGGQIGLTPAMGWNSWNCWGMEIDEAKIKAAADAMVSSGLKDYGWNYINMDDGWEADDRDPKTGELLGHPDRFPDMKRLIDYIHGKGLKAGIYSSPGKMTCGKKLGSLLHEKIDADTWANWGIDYLKYDKCSYGELIPANGGLYWHKLPYRIMQNALRETNRDIIYSLCQYGQMDVWKWGEEVDAQSWRTTGDIIDTWGSVRSIGFAQQAAIPFTKAGRFNDPDMLVVGYVGWGPNLHTTRLTADEQYAHISLWALLSSPLLLGCDLTKLDPFTISLLTNTEVLDVNQDPLVAPAKIIFQNADIAIYSKPLEDGSLAVGFFNLSNDERTLITNVSDLGFTGSVTVRDLWRQKEEGKVNKTLRYAVAPHGVKFIQVRK